MRQRRRKTCHVQHGATADDRHKRMAVEPRPIDLGQKFHHMVDIVLGSLTARDRQRLGGHFERWLMSRDIAPHDIAKPRVFDVNILIGDKHNPVTLARLHAIHGFQENLVVVVKKITSEVDGKMIFDREALPGNCVDLNLLT
jgi:hypothetical protein